MALYNNLDGIRKDSFYINLNKSGNKTIVAGTTDTINPTVFFDDSTKHWEFTQNNTIVNRMLPLSTTAPLENLVPTYDVASGQYKPEVGFFSAGVTGITTAGLAEYPVLTMALATPDANHIRFTLTPPTGGTMMADESGGRRTLFNTAQSVDIDIRDGYISYGTNWIYFNQGVLEAGPTLPVTVPTRFYNCLVGTFYLTQNKVVVWFANEQHGSTDILKARTMSPILQEYLHSTVGCRYDSGFAVTRITTGTGGAEGDIQINCSGGIIWDEDLKHVISHNASPANNSSAQNLGATVSNPATIPVLYRSGDTATIPENWVNNTADTYPIMFSTRASYNRLTGSVWDVQPITDNGYGVYYICATNSYYYHNGTKLASAPIVSIMGQTNYGTDLAAAQAAVYTDLVLGTLPSNELRPLFKLIIKTKNTYDNTKKSYIYQITDLRSITTLPSNNCLVTDHGSLTGRSNEAQHPASSIETVTTEFNGILTTGDINVQLALDTIDNIAVKVAQDIGGTNLLPQVIGIRSISVSTTTITTGQILQCNGTIHAPISLSGNATMAVGGAVTVLGVQGQTYTSTATVVGQVRFWNGSYWAVSSTGAAGNGDVLTWDTANSTVKYSAVAGAATKPITKFAPVLTNTTTSYTVTSGDCTILTDASAYSGGNYVATIDMESAPTNGHIVCIKNKGATGSVRINRNSKTIEGIAADQYLYIQNDYLTLQYYSADNNWEIVGEMS